MKSDEQGSTVSALLNELLLTATGGNPAAVPSAATVIAPGSTGAVGSDSVVSAATSNTGSSLEQELQRLAGEVTLLRQVNELNQTTLDANTKALEQAASQGKSSGSSAASTAKTIGSFFLGGLGIGSLISGISSLFGGGSDQPAPAPLIKYTPPPVLQYQGAVGSNGQVSAYDYNDRGGIRPVDGQQSAQTSRSAATQVVVQVNAMDSKSFMDHSDEIAQAVRAAMLNSSSLNDVISEI